MDEATIDLILAGSGITPGHPQYAGMRSALIRQGQAMSSTQGEDTRRWDLTFEQQQREARSLNQREKDKLEQEYRIAKMSARNQEESNAIDRWKAEKDYEINQQRIEIERGNLEVAKGAQGLELLRTGVDLGSQVNDWAKQSDWFAGVRANDQAPAFLQALLKNATASVGSNAPTMTAPIGLPEQNSLQAMLANMGVGTAPAPAMQTATPGAAAATAAQSAAPSNSATGVGKPAADPRTVAIQAIAKAYQPSGVDGYDEKDMASIRAIAALAAQGTNKTANRAAMLDDSDKGFITGGLQKLGIDADRWWRQSDAQRVGQGSSRAA